ncbi:MAG: carboxypeptidase-like regulatory domain-containing protein, partial [Planctomycetota bacterium]
MVELDVLGAVRAVADGRAYDATHVRFRERLELETSAAAAGRIAAGRDAVWWTGFLVLITEHDPAFRIEEENMARTTVRIGPWMLAVLAGSLSWNEPATGAAAAEPAATRTPLDPVAAPSAPAGEQIMMRGRVLDPVGAPLNGASVCVIPSHYSKTPLTAIASVRSDADGRFTIAFDPKACDYFENTQLEPWRNADLVATAQGFGPAWVACGNVSGNDATLRLAYDLPIEGRVVDLEAQPVAGARVAVVSLMAPESGDLSDHLRRFSLGEMPWGPGRRVTSLSTSVLPSASVATDADGRFTLSGIGRERMVTLEISGETTALTRATVVTRVMEPFTH